MRASVTTSDRPFPSTTLTLTTITRTPSTPSALSFSKSIFVRAFTEDEALIEMFCDLIVMIAVSVCGNATQYFYLCVFKSAGQQTPAAKIALVSLWAVGLPMAYILAKPLGYGADGVVTGLCCGFAIEIPLMWWKTRCWDWPTIAAEASRRLGDKLAAADAETLHHHNGANSLADSGPQAEAELGSVVTVIASAHRLGEEDARVHHRAPHNAPHTANPHSNPQHDVIDEKHIVVAATTALPVAH